LKWSVSDLALPWFVQVIVESRVRASKASIAGLRRFRAEGARRSRLVRFVRFDQIMKSSFPD
jgi:hypothetical protein